MSLIHILNKILENKSYRNVSNELNVSIGTIKRWKLLNNVPNHYQFDLMKMNNIDIDYSCYNYNKKINFIHRLIQ